MKWLVGLFLVSCCATVWSFLSGDEGFVSSSSSSGDPVVETVRKGENTTFHIARFAPRVDHASDVEYKYSFSLPNTGSEALVIAETIKSCSCFQAEVDREEILPGDSATVQIAIKPSNLISSRGTFTLKMDSGDQHIFDMRSWTYPPVVIDRVNDATISFGLLTPGRVYRTSRRLLVYSYAGETPPELRWEPPNDESHLRCRLMDQGIESYHGGQVRRRVYDLGIELRVGTVAQLNSRAVNFLPINGGIPEYEFSETVVWNVGSPIKVDPARWIVRRGDVSDQGVLKETVTLQGLEETLFRIANIETGDQCLSVESMIETGSVNSSIELPVRLDLKVVPPQKSFLGRIKIGVEYVDVSSTDKAHEYEIEFPVIVTE